MIHSGNNQHSQGHAVGRDHTGYFGVFTLLFFLSGAAALAYQVVWMRKLSLFLGSDIYSSSITLAAFMGGLALGGYVASRFVDRVTYHVVYYGVLEILIGLFALSFDRLLLLFDPVIASAYARLFDQSQLSYNLLRSGIVFTVLLIPTTMMGATLPLILKAFSRRAAKLGEVTGHFYAVNTFGALSGVLFSAFVLLPRLGLRNTGLVAVTVNVAIGAAILLLCLRSGFRAEFFIRPGVRASGDKVPEAAEPDTDAAPPPPVPRWRTAALVAIGISGFGGLALEVVWTRVLIQSFSATVYSFGMMLVGFLLGIALGSKAVAPHIRTPERAVGLLAKIEIGLSVSVAILAGLSFLIPSLFGTLVWRMSALSPALFGLASVLGALLVSMVFVLPSTMLLGAAFPAALRAYNVNLGSTGRDSGRIAFINTTGAVTGALVAGFVLIPLMGSRNGLMLLSAVFFLNGSYVQFCTLSPRGRALRGFVLPRAAYVAVLFVVVAPLIPSRTVLNYNVQHSSRPDIVFHSEDAFGLVDVVRTPEDKTILAIDGNIEADNTLTQLRHFVLKGHLPLMFSSEPKEVLIVGLGLGITTASVLKHADVHRVDVVELLPSVVEAQKYLEDINGDVLADPRLKLHVDDGRNFLRNTENRYDMITADPVHPRISGVGVLYTREYYRLIRDHLEDDGVVLQWMPLYSISETSFEVAARSMFEVFPHTSVWYVPGHILFLGAKTAPPKFDYEVLKSKMADRTIAADLKAVGIQSILGLMRLQIMAPSDLRGFLNRDGAGEMVNTEDLPYLEYHTPFEFLTSPESNLSSLLPFAGNDAGLVTNGPDGFSAELGRAQAAYRDSILPR
jgi:spermidine synthase